MQATELSSMIDKVLSVNDRTQPSLTNCISEESIQKLLVMARQVFLSQPMMLEIEPPMQVCADIHGQYSDLLRIFNKIGWPPDRSYLFLGDYVDRGRQQLEVIILLTAYKCKYAEQFFMLRGNHECRPVNRVYGFFEEVKRRYSVRLYEDFQDLFNVMPLTALIGSRIFCMHGGLSPDIRSWSDLRDIKRPLEVGETGLAVDLLWSDPEENSNGWQESSRGISFTFGADIVQSFCEKMDVDLVARGHQVVMDGYEFFAGRLLVTIFSAPRYCGEFDNKAASMNVASGLLCSFTVLKPTGQLKIRVPKDRLKSRGRKGEDVYPKNSAES
ncbi:hypothetical protein PMAYCL1PPCAC_12525 [Pristionchus mayeri]|uniref:Serine/threonine-protein phosphatase n=1 Tax=Pristionchus mayeri TaxID=1317129 RepID=A0AAN4ZSG3_9BILA|nr:hypothetical protein PMAYCL1PPCAC_12525 [Pristionchus mayeri]